MKFRSYMKFLCTDGGRSSKRLPDSLKLVRRHATPGRLCLQAATDRAQGRGDEERGQGAGPRAEAAKSPTFERCALDYMAMHEASWRSAVHRQQWNNTLSTYAHPVIGTKPVDGIDTDEVLKILRSIWATKNEMASLLRGRIEKILDAAKVQKYRSGENPARWVGHLALLPPARSKVNNREHHPALPWDQVPAFVAELRTMPGLAARVLEFAIMTAARTNEVRRMIWSEVAGDVWTVPGVRMKSGKQHRVPLTASAVERLRGFNGIRLGETVFPGEGGSTLTDSSLSGSLRALRPEC